MCNQDSKMFLLVMEACDEGFMREAISEAYKAWEKGEVPVGAVIVHDNKIIARGHNNMITLNDPSAHAEVMAMRECGKVLDNYRLIDCTLYVTLEPCVMCTGAMIHGRIKRVVYGASDYKTGAIDSVYKLLTLKHYHYLYYTKGVLEEECSRLISDFFKERRLCNKAKKLKE